MAELMVERSGPSRGSIKISGAKNASLPEMAACLLTDKPLTLDNVPRIKDVEYMENQLKSYGVNVGGRSSPSSPLVLNASSARFSPLNDAGKKTRGAFLVLGPLMARFRQATVYLPGGCQIGRAGRPVDFHIDALKQMGAQEVPGSDGCITLTARNGLQGADIRFPKVSVGATENIVMAATLATGKTTIKNAALEPEVIDLVDMLKNMGAKIQVNEGGREITISGQAGKRLSGTRHTVIPDRIEAGTYAIAAAIAGGQLLLKMDPSIGEKILDLVIEKLRDAGVQVIPRHDGLLIKRSDSISPVSITTGPYPEFPTDLLPQWVSFMTQAQGTSRIEDTIYDGRFNHVPDLIQMGADISQESVNICHVHGKNTLRGKRVKASDLRAGVALIIAAMAAEGTTVVKKFEHVLRGYENIKEKLKQCGAKVEELAPTRSGHYGCSQ